MSVVKLKGRGALSNRAGRFASVEHERIEEVMDAHLAAMKAANKLPINHPQQLDPMDILRWPGVTNTARPDMETLERPMAMSSSGRMACGMGLCYGNIIPLYT